MTQGTKVDTSVRIAAYLKAHRDQLELLERMWSDPRVQFYNDEHMPSDQELALGAVFPVGPTSRHQFLMTIWRCQFYGFLREADYKGIIYSPEPRGLEEDNDFTERGYIHHWESSRLFHKTTVKAIWVPRMADELLGLNTNYEWGRVDGYLQALREYSEMFANRTDPTAEDLRFEAKQFKVFIGWPDEAERMGLPRHYSLELGGMKRYDTLRRLSFAAAGKVPPEDLVQAIVDDDIPF